MQHVVIGVISNAQHEFLLAKRHADVHLGGLWEFPGGKKNPEETSEQALARELKEELDITIADPIPFSQYFWHYSEKSVYLDFWRIETFTGVAKGKEGQPIRWVRLESMRKYPMPQANQAILEQLNQCDESQCQY